MKTSFTTKFAAATGLTALLVGGLVPSVAHADPVAESGKSSYGQLSGVGSDTTQDVMNGLSIALGRVSALADWKLASYDAAFSSPNTGTIQTKSDGNTAIGRPNGSTEGLNALKVAIGAATSGSGTRFGGGASSWTLDGGANDVVGDLQFSRSSSGPTVVANGVVTYVPFAKDAVGYAVSANTVMPPLSKGLLTDAADGSGVTPSTLWAIYNCAATRIITKAGQTTKLVNNSYTLGDGETSTRIRAYVPQSGSGTQKFWQGASGAQFGSSIPNCVEQKKFVAGDAADVSGGNNTFTSGADYSGASVQEHDGSAIENVPGAIMPYSIPKWIGQAKGLPGVTDARHGAVIGTLNGIAGTDGSGSNLTINPAFLNVPVSTAGAITSTLARSVYNVVPTRVLNDATSLEYKMFKGRTSLICSAAGATVIRNYGFGVLTATSGANSCGDSSQLAVAATTPTVTAAATDDSANREIDFDISVFTSNGTAGAMVTVKATNGTTVTYPFATTIAAGATSKTFSVPYSALAAGTQALKIQVVPNLPGIASYESSTLVTKAGAVTTLSATVTGKAGQAGSAVVTVAPTSATGTVSIYRGTSATGSALATGTLSSGSATIALPSQSKGSVPLFIVYSGDATNAASSKAVTWKVK